MELRKHLDFRKVFIGIYILAFSIYLVVGLQPAEATQYEVSAELNIPSINLTSDVTTLHLQNHLLQTPDTIVGSFTRHPGKTLLIGHASTVFQNLNQIHLDDEIIYDDTTYRVTDLATVEKSAVNMSEFLTPTDHDTIIIMTCAGTIFENGDATHRLIVTAIAK